MNKKKVRLNWEPSLDVVTFLLRQFSTDVASNIAVLKQNKSGLQAADKWWVVPEEAAFLFQLELAEVTIDERPVRSMVEFETEMAAVSKPDIYNHR